MPLTKGTTCIFGRLCPIFTMVCSTFYLSALQISLTLLGIAFSKTKLTFSLVPLTGRNFQIVQRKQLCHAIIAYETPVESMVGITP